MPPYAGPSAARTGDVVGTLWLLAYLAMGMALVVLDHRGGWLTRTRNQISAVADPLRAVAGLPGRMAERIGDDAGTISQLTARNRELRKQLLLNQVRMARLQTVAADNARLRGMLDAAERGKLEVRLTPILDVDLDPTRQRVVLDAGSSDGLKVGQSVIDAGGLLGQIIGTTPMYANVLLLTDPSHAVPVAIARNGVRLVVYGTGRGDLLSLTNVPLSSDVKVGDVLVTSGLGGRFPPGFPVGTIAHLRPDESRAFLLGDVKPAAQLDRGREVLVQLSMPAQMPQGIEFDTAPVDMPGIEKAGTGNGEAGSAGTSASKPASSATASAAPERAQPAPPPRRMSPATTNPVITRPTATRPAATAPATVPPEPTR